MYLNLINVFINNLQSYGTAHRGYKLTHQSQVFQSQTILQTIRSVKKSQKMSSLKNPIEMFDGKIFWKIFL